MLQFLVVCVSNLKKCLCRELRVWNSLIGDGMENSFYFVLRIVVAALIFLGFKLLQASGGKTTFPSPYKSSDLPTS